MSGPVSPPLATTESGTTVRVQPTNTLEFNGADFTVTQSGSKASIAIDSTGTGAALTDTHIGFGSAANLLTGSANFTFTEESGGSGPVVLLTGDKPQIQIQDDTAATNYFTSIVKSGHSLIFSQEDSTGNDTEFMRFASSSILFNEDGASLDLKIKGNTVDDLFVSDGGLDSIGIGVVPPSSHGSQTVRMTVQSDDDDIALMLQNAGTDADDGPEMVLYRNSASPAADDLLGRIRFDGEDSGDNIHTYFRMTNAIKDPTDASEDGRFTFESRAGGFLIETMRFEGDDVIFNYNATNSVDVKILGDNDTILFSDASQDNLGIGTSTPSSGVERLHIIGTGSGEIVRIESTDDGAGSGPDIVFLRNSASPAVGDDIGTLSFKGKDSVGNTIAYANIKAEIDNPTDTDEAGRLEFDVRHGQGGTTSMTSFIRLLGEANSVQSLIKFNDDAQDIDFIYEDTSGGELVKFDLGNSNVGIGGAPDSDVKLHVKATGTDTLVRLESTDADADHAPTLELYRNSATPADNDLIGKIEFSANDAGGAKHVLGSIRAILRDEAAGGEDGTVLFEAAQFGSDAVEFMRYGLDPGQSNRQVIINNSNTSYISFLVKGSSAAIISTDPSANNFNVNPFGNANVDMIVQGDTDTRLIRTDASQDNIGISCDPSAGGAKLQVDNGISYLRETSNTFTANHDITEEQAHGYVLVMDASSGASNTFTLPEVAAIGMHVKLVNLAGSNGMTVAVSGSSTHQINGAGSAGSSSVSTTTKFQTIECHYVATNVWVATEPAVAA